MPQRTVTQSIAAGATFDPMDSWQYQYTDTPGILKVNHNATAVGLRCQLTATEVTILQDSAVPAGGVSGVIPSDFTVPPIIERVPARKRLSLLYTNPTAGAIIVNVMFDLTQGGGGRKGRK
jgi:hypothetical protein